MAFSTTRSQAGAKAALSADGGKGCSRSTLNMMLAKVPTNGFSPVKNWYRMTPHEKRSLRKSTVWP